MQFLFVGDIFEFVTTEKNVFKLILLHMNWTSLHFQMI